ncbi:hypothetical protein [Polaribacter ponticola]|uniref:Uncharacterized protein n=1 Tax=Polaribacter ponticola TaxID=2978475 RepID=A0ABT5SC12_9FLAO|nr:hypothetical protein [Polaribacter sp. MSW5]MDD7915652.1 hypothetical protein [Polaribacter sp. MSW5]
MASLPSTYTTKELLQKLKKQKLLLIFQIIIVFLMFVFAIFSTIEKGISFQTFLPLFFAPMIFVMLYETKK